MSISRLSPLRFGQIFISGEFTHNSVSIASSPTRYKEAERTGEEVAVGFMLTDESQKLTPLPEFQADHFKVIASNQTDWPRFCFIDFIPDTGRLTSTYVLKDHLKALFSEVFKDSSQDAVKTLISLEEAEANIAGRAFPPNLKQSLWETLHKMATMLFEEAYPNLKLHPSFTFYSKQMIQLAKSLEAFRQLLFPEQADKVGEAT